MADSVTSGFGEFSKALENIRLRMNTSVKRKALKAGAEVIATAMSEDAPVLDRATAKSTSLEPGDVRDDMKARVVTEDEEPVGIAGPTKKTKHVVRWLEEGHRNVKGGYSTVVDGKGRTRGPGRQLEGKSSETKPHQFLEGAFERSVSEAEAARDEVLAKGLGGEV